MNEVPWWARSPSPMTLTVYFLLAIYGAHRLESQSFWSWVKNFCESAFVIGLVILPYDSSWQIFQWLKWGYLHPMEYRMVIGVLIRNIAVFSLCLLSSWKLALETDKLKLTNMMFVLFPIFVLIVKFTFFTPDPVWSDWTYGLRFEQNSPWLIAYFSGLVDKVSLGLVYVSLWKENFLNGKNV